MRGSTRSVSSGGVWNKFRRPVCYTKGRCRYDEDVCIATQPRTAPVISSVIKNSPIGFQKRTCSIVAAVGLLSFATTGCDRASDRPSAESQPAEKTAHSAEADDETAKPGGPRKRPHRPSETGERRGRQRSENTDTANRATARFEIDGRPFREEYSHPKLTARETAELPLRASPDEEADVVGHLNISKGDVIDQTGDTKLFVAPEKKSAPTSLVLPRSLHVAGPEPDENVEVEEGETIAFYRRYIGEGGYEFYVWHDGVRYAGSPRYFDIPREFFEKMALSDKDDLEIFEGEESSWWVETEGDGSRGWLRVDRDSIAADIETSYPWR